MNPQEPTQPPYTPPSPGVQPPTLPPEEYDPKQRVSSELSVMQPGEVVICEIKRHPIGIIVIYIGLGFLLTLVAILVFGVAPSMLADSTSSRQATQIGSVILLLLAVISAIYALIGTVVYWGNKWIVTSDSVTQVTRTSLFKRQSAQLALINIEDVTAEQNGILAHVFNYGVLKAETAGHRSKFVFPYCPNPNFYAKRILEAREALGPANHGHASY